jgi:hypothetical protein
MLGRKTTALYEEAKALHRQLDRCAYGPPPVRPSDAEIGWARAAGVLLELDRTHARDARPRDTPASLAGIVPPIRPS